MDASKVPGWQKYRDNLINSPVSSSNVTSFIKPIVPNGSSVVSQSQIQQASPQNQGDIEQHSQNQQAQSSQSAQQHASSSSPVLPKQIQRPKRKLDPKEGPSKRVLIEVSSSIANLIIFEIVLLNYMIMGFSNNFHHILLSLYSIKIIEQL